MRQVKRKYMVKRRGQEINFCPIASEKIKIVKQDSPVKAMVGGLIFFKLYYKSLIPEF